jgi:hypothetical protein
MPADSARGDQSRAALRRANEIRVEIAAMRRGLRSGEASWREVFAADLQEGALGSMRLAWLLEAIPGIGPQRESRIARSLGRGLTCRLRELTPQQVELLETLIAQASREG